MNPEEQLAIYLHDRWKLQVPIDVEKITSDHASVEADYLPVNSDAVVITEAGQGNSRPLIILSKTIPETRKRFTLAHELGHILLPWHMGTFACQPGKAIRLGDFLYQSTEAEANRFASEFLMPTKWLRPIVETSGMSALQCLKFCSGTAGTSYDASLLSMTRVWPPGFAFAIVDSANNVQLSGHSSGTAFAFPKRGSPFKKISHNSGAILDETFTLSYGRTVFLTQVRSGTSPSTSTDLRSGNDILHAIAASVSSSEAELRSLKLSATGVLGYANGRIKTGSASQLLSAFQAAFYGRAELHTLVSHPDFETYLIKKSIELSARKKSI